MNKNLLGLILMFCFSVKAADLSLEGSNQAKNVSALSQVYMTDMRDKICIYDTKLYSIGAVVVGADGSKIRCAAVQNVDGKTTTTWQEEDKTK